MSEKNAATEDEAPIFNRLDGGVVDFLLSRRSTLARLMTPPGPNKAAVKKILEAGARVPDHGKLAPWRFVVFQDQAVRDFADVIVRSVEAEEPALNTDSLRSSLTQAPVLVAVLSTPVTDHKIPVWEQHLSAGAACQNIVIAAAALGFAVQWITGRGAYSAGVREYLGMKDCDQIAGFIFLGSPSEIPLKERPRPDVSEIIDWR